MIFPRFTLGRVAAGIAQIFNDLIESIRNNVEVFRVRNRSLTAATYPKGTIVTLFNDGTNTKYAVTATDDKVTTYSGVLEEPLVYDQVGICRHANVVFVRMVNGLALAVDDGVWETVTPGCGTNVPANIRVGTIVDTTGYDPAAPTGTTGVQVNLHVCCAQA